MSVTHLCSFRPDCRYHSTSVIATNYYRHGIPIPKHIAHTQVCTYLSVIPTLQYSLGSIFASLSPPFSSGELMPPAANNVRAFVACHRFMFVMVFAIRTSSHLPKTHAEPLRKRCCLPQFHCSVVNTAAGTRSHFHSFLTPVSLTARSLLQCRLLPVTAMLLLAAGALPDAFEENITIKRIPLVATAMKHY